MMNYREKKLGELLTEWREMSHPDLLRELWRFAAEAIDLKGEVGTLNLYIDTLHNELDAYNTAILPDDVAQIEREAEVLEALLDNDNPVHYG